MCRYYVPNDRLWGKFSKNSKNPYFADRVQGQPCQDRQVDVKWGAELFYRFLFPSGILQ